MADASNTWPTNAESYDIQAKIGKGAFATVYRAKCLTNDQLCAIKVLDLDVSIGANFVDIQQEVQTMRLSKHPNVLTAFTSFVSKKALFLVTPFCSKGSSLRCIYAERALMKRTKGGLKNEDHINYILYETLRGLKYFHDNGHIHRDIKAGNILIDGNSGDVRIADFGVAGWLTSAEKSRSNTKTFVGTPCWMAPEVMEQVDGYNYKADIWSFGITALELAKGYAPYAMYPPMKVLLMTIQEDPPNFETYNDDDDFEAKWSKSFLEIVKLCLQKDPRKRPSCDEVLKHRHFRKYVDENYRDEQKYKLIKELCDVIDDVGESVADSDSDSKRMPDINPVKVFTRSDDNEGQPAGTTWVFTDGSKIFTSPSGQVFESNDQFFDEFERQTSGIQEFSGGSKEKCKEEKEANEMEEFFDEFERTTGGENYRSKNR